ncbi:hypothetical protein ACQUSR_00535 [Streptomyces sp. P1-3]|uniref:hypothetical protein n=1 Tax=Streptomyces sp. P1-3 TaxID=3421658 RepID=UPI003D365547
MHRTLLALPLLVAVLVGASPALATSPPAGTRWEPAPSAPWTAAAGTRCAFPVHGEPVVDEVRRRVLETHPDGTAKRVAYKGDLVVRVTNTQTGASYDADAGGSAVVDYRADGSQFWTVRGPVLIGFGEDGGTLPRGLYTVDGTYTMDVSATGYKTLTMLRGSTDALCAHLD